jgi:hypothetical protein
MRVGTKSLLFGVHAFWWHPLVVTLAWIRLYRKLPNLHELVAIIFHDVGYWGCRDMDGDCGIIHPIRGARLVVKISRGLNFLFRPLGFRPSCLQGQQELCWGHSSAFARELGMPVSKLCAPDKLSVLFEPWWFYSLRARLSGELDEYVKNGPPGLTPRQWFRWLQRKFKAQYERISSQRSEDSQLAV